MTWSCSTIVWWYYFMPGRSVHPLIILYGNSVHDLWRLLVEMIIHNSQHVLSDHFLVISFLASCINIANVDVLFHILFMKKIYSSSIFIYLVLNFKRWTQTFAMNIAQWLFILYRVLHEEFVLFLVNLTHTIFFPLPCCSRWEWRTTIPGPKRG